MMVTMTAAALLSGCGQQASVGATADTLPDGLNQDLVKFYSLDPLATAAQGRQCNLMEKRNGIPEGQRADCAAVRYVIKKSNLDIGTNESFSTLRELREKK